MKIHYKSAMVGMAILFCGSLHAQQIDPLQKAMLNTYEQLLLENPKDWQTYFERGTMYYQMGQYEKALSDLAKAIQYTPSKETNYIIQTFSTLSDVNCRLENYQSALDAINKALEIQPQSYVNLYKKGNILLSLGRNDEALNLFRTLQNLKSRSQEAYFGMARAMIQKGDLSEVDDLIKEIENADPSNYATYCRIGDLYFDMERYEDAATNYLSAFALTNNSQRPLNSLQDVADKNFNAFERAVNYAIGKTSNKLPLYYILGNFAYDAGHYGVAREALANVLEMPTGKDASVMTTLALADMAVGRMDDSMEHINAALQLAPDASGYIAKSKIEMAHGNPAAAVLAAQKALQFDSSDINALLALAESQSAAGKGLDALNSLNEIIMINPENGYALILRAYVNEKLLNDEKSAKNDYMRAGQLDAKVMPMAAWKALGKHKSGKALDAQGIIDDALKSDGSADAAYWAAVYYAQTGNVEKGREMLEKAKEAGYENKYNLEQNNLFNTSVSPLR